MTNVSPLLLAACTAFLVFSAFNIKQQPKEGENKNQPETAICTKEACLKAAGAILDKLDQSVAPCKDFYQFACGNYIRRTVLPENMDRMSVVQSMEDEVLMLIYRALESPTLYRTSGSLIKAKMLYETCMNSDSLEDDPVRVLKYFLSEKGVGHWPVLEPSWMEDINLEWRLAMLFVHHAPIFFHMYCDATVSKEYVLNIYPAVSALGSKDAPDREKIFEAYHKLLIETLRLLGVPEVRVQMDSFDIIGFELQFATITSASQKCIKHGGRHSNNGLKYDEYMLYNITLDTLEDFIPQVKWTRLMSYIFRNLGLQIDATQLLVTVHCSDYFEKLGTLISNTPPRTLANFVSWKFVLSYMSFMSTPFRLIFQDYTLLSSELRNSKLKTYTSRWKGCVSLVGSWFETAIASYYAKFGYPPEVEKKAEELVADLKETFVEMITSSWLDEESKNATVDKILTMKEEIGYPRHLLNSDHVENFYAKLELSTDSLLKNMLKMSRFLVYNEMQKLNSPLEYNRQLIDTIYKGPLQGSANYFATKNVLAIPLGIMRTPMFEVEYPNYLNYGMLGNEIAHEMAHGFDNIGLQYDKVGKESRWWNEDMKNKFWMKAKCFVDQYNRYIIDSVTEKNVDGQKTLHENIADSAGLKQAFMTYQRFVKENGKEAKLPGLEYTNQQLFFISFAQMKCEVRNKEGFEEYIGDESMPLLKTPLRYRVNGALSNSEFFAAVFKCPTGSPMSQLKRCSVW